MALEAENGRLRGVGRPAIRAALLASRKLNALVVGVLMLAVMTVGAASLARAEQEQSYRVSEFPIRVAPGEQSHPVLSGKWMLWRDGPNGLKRISGRDLETGLDFAVPTGDGVLWPVDVGRDTVVTTQSRWDPAAGRFSQYGIFGYRLPDGQRFTIAAFRGGDTLVTSSPPRTDGKTIVWAEHTVGETERSSAINGFDLDSQMPFAISTNPASQDYPVVSGNFVAWLDQRNSPSVGPKADVFGYDLATRQEFRVTANLEAVGPLAISGEMIVWVAERENRLYLIGYDIGKKQEFTITRLPSHPGPIDVDGDLVVWSAKGDLDYDAFGYDLRQGKQFVISCAIGAQVTPRVSDRTVVWTDYRSNGVGKYDSNSDIYGARLEPGLAPVPPVFGAPDAADAKIEIVWPHGGAPVSEADKANVGVWLFLPGTSNLAPCQWNPQVQLWRSLNNEPARLVATGREVGRYFDSADSAAIPTWEFNDIDVSPARDPNNKVYFFVALEGVPNHTSIWSHGADARTSFPQQDVPGGVGPVSDAVDAKIEIVWPHDNAPVAQAKLVNIGVLLFSHSASLAVPPDFNATVRLYRALNNNVSQEVAVGQKRLTQQGDLTYPVWDFNNVDVSAANDPANKYYFTLKVDGVTTYTNVWAHGADARTYFPQMDTPTQGCQ